MNIIISCANKEGLKEFASKLPDDTVVYSSSGTYKELDGSAPKLVEIAEYTGFAEMPGGLVKTLNPKIHAGLLAELDKQDHKEYLTQHNIEQFDMVIVNLYPFEKTVSSGADREEIRHNIDIGGVSLIEAASKNMGRVLVVVDPADYDLVLEYLKNPTQELRTTMATKAFRYLANYLNAIATYYEQ